jgi:3,4-dihydroxy 2-butanone 4-phosphate synthase/GTP cyclohydrolase II
MTDHNETPLGTAFTVSIEAREGVSTGISAHDRRGPIRSRSIPRPGRTTSCSRATYFPSREAGRRAAASGPDRGGVDLARLAGLIPAGIVCEIMNGRRDDGPRARPRR